MLREFLILSLSSNSTNGSQSSFQCQILSWLKNQPYILLVQTIFSPFSQYNSPKTPMFRQRESNPHFIPQRDDPVIEFPTQTPHPRSRPPPYLQSRTSVEPPYGPRPQAPTEQARAQQNLLPPHPLPQQNRLPPHQVPHQVAAPATIPNQSHRESSPHFTPGPHSQPSALQPSGRSHYPSQHSHTGHYRPSSLQAPKSRRTRPVAWLVAAFCALFWIIIIVGGLIILAVYLAYRPRSPRFDISTVTLNAAYLDMGYLLNAEVTVLANFTNPNTKVNVDFSYVILDLYYEKDFIATRYIQPFSLVRRQSKFAVVHLVASQVRLSMRQSQELRTQMNNGTVNFEIAGLFRARSKLGGFLQYSYWLYAHCQITVTGPPTGILIGKKCVTKQ